jgi:hypothetical protein
MLKGWDERIHKGFECKHVCGATEPRKCRRLVIQKRGFSNCINLLLLP